MNRKKMNERIVQKEIRVKKCLKCDEYGRIETLNYPDKSECGYYYPFCNCKYGQWMKDNEEIGDMFYKARHGL